MVNGQSPSSSDHPLTKASLQGGPMTARAQLRFLFVCVFLSGGAALVYEVVWARQLSLFLGITTYAHAEG